MQNIFQQIRSRVWDYLEENSVFNEKEMLATFRSMGNHDRSVSISYYTPEDNVNFNVLTPTRSVNKRIEKIFKERERVDSFLNYSNETPGISKIFFRGKSFDPGDINPSLLVNELSVYPRIKNKDYLIDFSVSMYDTYGGPEVFLRPVYFSKVPKVLKEQVLQECSEEKPLKTEHLKRLGALCSSLNELYIDSWLERNRDEI